MSEEIVKLTNVADRVIPNLISHGAPLTNPVLHDKVEEKVFFLFKSEKKEVCLVPMLITVLEGKTELSDKVKEEEVKTDVVQSIQIMLQKKGVYIAYILFFSSPSFSPIVGFLFNSILQLFSFLIRVLYCTLYSLRKENCTLSGIQMFQNFM